MTFQVLILLPLPPKCWEFEKAAPHPAYLNSGKGTQGIMRPKQALQQGSYNRVHLRQLNFEKDSALNSATLGWESPT